MSLLAQISEPLSEPTPAPVIEVGPAQPVTIERWEKFAKYWQELKGENFGEKLWAHAQSAAFWVDLGAVMLCVAIAAILTPLLRKRAMETEFYPVALVRKRLGASRKFPLFLVLTMLLFWLSVLIAGLMDKTCPILRAVTIFTTAYLAIHVPSVLAPGRFWVKPLATIVISATVLHMFGLLEFAVSKLDGWGIQIGDARISILSLISGPVIFLVAYGVGRLFIGAFDRRLGRSVNVPPSVRVLTGKLLNLGMLVVIIGVTLTAMGINLTALTVFGGALGLGIGFGLQKVISNLFSGVIILLDKSIKPGDVIEIQDTYGKINGLQTRYVSVVTRDNKEYLIPNEDFITQPVINWSFSDRLVRLRAAIGVAYGTDLREAIRLAEEATASQDRVRENPVPRCLVRGFGDSSINLELRFWITDPEEGCANVTSDILLAVWDAFREHGIEIPFPQRDLHLRSGGEVLRELVSPDRPDPD